MGLAGELRERYQFMHTTSEEVMAEMGHREYVVFPFKVFPELLQN